MHIAQMLQNKRQMLPFGIHANRTHGEITRILVNALSSEFKSEYIMRRQSEN